MFSAALLLIPLAATPLNPADLPNRCPNARMFAAVEDFGWADFRKRNPTADRDRYLIEQISQHNLRTESSKALLSWVKDSDYYAHRGAIQKKWEAFIAEQQDPQVKEELTANYAMALLLLGEFNHLLATYAPPSAAYAGLAKNTTINFAISQVYQRQHSYKLGQKFAKIAFDLSPQLDTRWGLMTADLTVYGKDLAKKHDKRDYTTQHIEALFPAKDWSGIPFEDVTEASGVRALGAVGSVAWADLDGDGWDELIKEDKFFPFEIYKNDHGKLTLQPNAVPGGDDCTTLGLVGPADIDNDGKPDFFRHCCNLDGEGPTEVLKNMGELRFEDITKQSGLDFKSGAGTVAAWADYDLDGFIDLAVGDGAHTSRLYHNTGHGTFVDVTAQAGTRTPGREDHMFGTIGVTWVDLDDDGYPDLFIQGWGWKRLFMNNKDGTFRETSKAAGLDEADDIKGYSTHAGDFDGDGKMDLFVGQYVVTSGKIGYNPSCTCSNLLRPEGYEAKEWKHASTIYRNNGDGTFTDMAKTTHFLPLGTMSINSEDWDNDGDLDIVMGAGGPYFQQEEPFLFYENLGNFQFALKTPFHDMKLWGKGHGMAYGDYDHDGNLDLFAINGGGLIGDVFTGMLLHNKGNTNHWVEVAFKPAPGTNASAIGARVHVTAGGKTRVRDVVSGGYFGDTNTLRVHVGLGDATTIDSIEIRWPNKKLDVTKLTNVPVDETIEVTEVDGTYKQLWSAPHGANSPPPTQP